MNKVKQFIKNNKTEIKVMVYGTAMFCAGIYLGKKYEAIEWDNSLIRLGDSGLNPKKIIGNNKYTISVLKEQIE